MLSHYGNMIDSRSFLDAMFSIQPRVDNNCHIDTFISDCIQAFAVVRETIVKPDRPPDGLYTADQCHQNFLKVQQETLNQICMSFMVNLLPPELRAEVIKKKPNSMASIAETARQSQRILQDKTRPLGTDQVSNNKLRVLAVLRKTTWKI